MHISQHLLKVWVVPSPKPADDDDDDDKDKDKDDEGDGDGDEEQLGSFFLWAKQQSMSSEKTVGGGSRGGAVLHRALVTTEVEFKMSAQE